MTATPGSPPSPSSPDPPAAAEAPVVDQQARRPALQRRGHRVGEVEAGHGLLDVPGVELADVLEVGDVVAQGPVAGEHRLAAQRRRARSRAGGGELVQHVLHARRRAGARRAPGAGRSGPASAPR